MEKKRAPLNNFGCKYFSSRWNDDEQRNYIRSSCANPQNIGGRESTRYDNCIDPHGKSTWSGWYLNKGMKYRCDVRGNSVNGCSMAVTDTKPEFPCERFVPEEAHPNEALVLREEIRDRFYQADMMCASCQKCLEAPKLEQPNKLPVTA